MDELTNARSRVTRNRLEFAIPSSTVYNGGMIQVAVPERWSVSTFYPID